MSKILLFIVAFHAFIFQTAAQSGQWIWMKGDSIGGSTGIFGTLGVPDVLNTPPGLYESVSWTDLDGNLWLFGGVEFAFTNVYNALSKFDPATNNWAWMKGSNLTNQPGTYGSLGVPGPNNNPGARGWGAASWTDSAGHLWLFGGYGFDSQGFLGELNDLWMFDINTNEWTWMKGSPFVYSSGSYGTQTVEAASNEVSARDEAVGSWTGKDNMLWYYGGYSNQGDMNDLWRYNINSNNWTWMKGSSTPNFPPTYGTLGIADPTNDPGGRSVYSRWIDCEGNLWFHGGNFWSDFSQYADMWKYDPVVNEFTCMKGPLTVSGTGVAGNFCESDTAFYPAARYENRACWTDEQGNFWMFGGYTLSGTYNDLWLFDQATNEWSLLHGSLIQNQNGFYGQQGVSNPLNVPSGKMGPVSWLDTDGNFWVFGGNKKIPFSLISMNDLWKYIPDSNCAAISNICNEFQLPAFFASDTDVCTKFCIDFFDQSATNPVSWQWSFEGGSPDTSSTQNPTGICYNLAGTYDVTLITLSGSDIDTVLFQDYITVYPSPPIPVITQNGNLLISSPATTYQWQFNAVDISGATIQSHVATQSGIYTVIVGDSNGCINSASVDVVITGEVIISSGSNIHIYPNPSQGSFTLEMDECCSPSVTVRVLNTLAQVILTDVVEKNASNHFSTTFDLSHAPDAVYFFEIQSESSRTVVKGVKN